MIDANLHSFLPLTGSDPIFIFIQAVTVHCGWMPTFFAMLACRAMSFLKKSVNSSGELPSVPTCPHRFRLHVFYTSLLKRVERRRGKLQRAGRYGILLNESLAPVIRTTNQGVVGSNPAGRAKIQ